MTAVHLRVGPGRYRCGIGRRWASQNVTSTTRLSAVTCKACRRLVLAAATYPELARIARGAGVLVLEDAETQAARALAELDRLRSRAAGGGS